ncbi:MAG: hypothetical protein ACWA5W_10125 [Phycisphaerales bacterium]
MRSVLLLILITPLLLHSPSFAQEGDTPKPTSTPTPTSTSDPLPSLDELLGLEDAPADSTQSTTQPTTHQAELDAILSPKQAGQAFTQAVGLMEQVARRLDQHHDLSLETQRLQQDILTKLDQVIASAQKGNSKGSSSSSSSQSQGSNQQQPDQQQAQAEGQPGNQPGDPAGESMPAPGSQADPNAPVAPDGVTWGSLPERIRQALSQGFSDQYSELYRKATEEYYKALAEDDQ